MSQSLYLCDNDHKAIACGCPLTSQTEPWLSRRSQSTHDAVHHRSTLHRNVLDLSLTAGHHMHTLWPPSLTWAHAACRLTVVRKQSQASADQGGTPGSVGGTPGSTSASQVSRSACPWWVPGSHAQQPGRVSGTNWLGVVQMQSQHGEINCCRFVMIICLV